MEAYIKQKRAAPGMVQSTTANEYQRPMSGLAATTTTATIKINTTTTGRQMQGYDGPLQFLTSPNNPDQILPLSTPTTPINEDGK